MMLPTPDPALQAVIEADFRPVNLIVNPEGPSVFCEAHKNEKCDTCDQDYVGLNRLARVLATNPSIAAPPPANVVSRNLSQAVNHTKEEGNVCLYYQ
jgi:translocation protein SEC72